MALGIELRVEALRTIAFGGISGTYAAIGTPFANPGRLLYIVNTTDVLLTFSYDGVIDHFVLPSNVSTIIDVCTNQSSTQGFYISTGTQLYVKGAPTTGSVYVTYYYARNI